MSIIEVNHAHVLRFSRLYAYLIIESLWGFSCLIKLPIGITAWLLFSI